MTWFIIGAVVIIVVGIVLVSLIPTSIPGRRGIIHSKITENSRYIANVTALVEEVDNLGNKSIIKYIAIAGIDSYYNGYVKDIIGTVIDHDKIEWLPEKKK